MISSKLNRVGAVRRGPRPGTAFLLLFLVVLAGAPKARAAIVPYMGLEDLAREGEVVVLGSVEAADAGWSDDGRIIVTRVTVTVEKAINGGPRTSVELEVPGGTVGGQTLVASGAPFFRKGDRVVLFLQHGAPGPGVSGAAGAPGTASGARGSAPVVPLAVVGWNQGRFEVERDPRTQRDIVRQPAGGTLYVDAQGRPAARDSKVAGPRELSDFLKEVEGLVARGRHAPGAGRP